MTLRASAFASAREVADRLAELRDARQTIRPITATTTMMSTSKKPSMRPAYSQENADLGLRTNR